MLLPLLVLLQTPVPTPGLELTYAHVPLVAFKAVVGTKQQRIGLYSGSVCNKTAGERKFAEGSFLPHAVFGVIDPALYSTLIREGKKNTKTYKWAKVLEYTGLVTGGSVGPKGGAIIKFIGLIVAGTGNKLAAAVQRDTVEPEVIQALLVTSRVMLLEPGSCQSRLMFGEYKRALSPYTLQLP